MRVHSGLDDGGSLLSGHWRAGSLVLIFHLIPFFIFSVVDTLYSRKVEFPIHICPRIHLHSCIYHSGYLSWPGRSIIRK